MTPLPPGYRPDRRDLLRLAAAGTLSLFVPGCPSPSEDGVDLDAVPCRIHGQDHELGHLLRTGALQKRKVSEELKVPVLIVGAGIAGLSCAWRLRREGVEDVRVLDAGRRPGGNSRWDENDVTRFPWGAHYLRVPTREHRALERFLEEVGLIRGRDAKGGIDWDTRAVCMAPHERLFEGGIWGAGLFPPPRSRETIDVRELERFEEEIERLSSWRDTEGRRAFAIPISESSQDPDMLKLDRITFASWLDDHAFTRPALRWFLEYACRDDYGCALETTSAWAGLHYFCARRSDDPTRDAILAWPEGNGRLVQLLQEHRGPARVESRALCFGIEPGAKPGEPSTARVYLADRDRVVRFRAEQLVFAGPQYVLAKLLPQPDPWQQAFSYSPWLVANVTLSEAPGGTPVGLAWDNVFHGESFDSLGYVVANRDGAADAPTVVTWYWPLSGPDPRQERARLLALDSDAIKERVVKELLTAHPPLAGKIQAIDAWRWGHAMVRPVPGFLWGKRLAARRPRSDALLCANSDLSGIPIFEEAFYRGVVAGEQALGRLGKEFKSIL